MGEEELIAAAADGQAHAGTFLVSVYAPQLLAYARAVAPDLSDADREMICELAIEKAMKRSPNTRAQVGVGFAVLMGRAWLMGIVILVVGLAGSKQDGLMAALVALVAFSVYLATQLIIRPMERNTPST